MQNMQSAFQRAFTGGELAPSVGARADVDQYTKGLRLCKNFIVRRTGGVDNRSGTKFVVEVKTSANVTRLMAFVFEGADQTYVLEFGNLYVRFVWHGGQVIATGIPAYSGATNYTPGDVVESAGTNYVCILATIGNAPPNATFWYALTGAIYELPTPYTSADLARLQSTQSADVLVLTHPSYAPRELQRFGHTKWGIVTLSTAASVSPPTGLGGAAGAAGTRTYAYVVTTAKVKTFEESVASSTRTYVNCAEPTLAAPNTITWVAASNAQEYYVYCDPYGNGIFGYIGAATGLAFSDVGFTPDFTITPPIAQTLFNVTGDYPAACAYHQQRLFLAGTNNEREKVWGSSIGSFHNFNISTPLQDDDAISFILNSKYIAPVAHLVPLKRLVVLTDSNEWVLQGDESGVLTPTAINADIEGYLGAKATIPPVLIGDRALFVQARGTSIRELIYAYERSGFSNRDISILAQHLFDGFTVADLTFQHVPYSVVWAVRSDGTLLGLTYVPEQEIWAWHRHTTGASGVFESCVAVPSTSLGEDELYVIVKRTISGATKRYIERFAKRGIVDVQRDIWFVDSGLQYDGTPITTVTGLSHLNGQVVAVFADGGVVFDGDPADPSAAQFTVAAGAITLTAAKSVITVGIPIRFADLETLDLDVAGSAVRDKKKRVQGVTLIVASSFRTFLAGPDENHLLLYRPEAWQPSVTLATEPEEINLTTAWAPEGRVMIRHDQPVPLTVLGLIPNVEIGG